MTGTQFVSSTFPIFQPCGEQYRKPWGNGCRPKRFVAWIPSQANCRSEEVWKIFCSHHDSFGILCPSKNDHIPSYMPSNPPPGRYLLNRRRLYYCQEPNMGRNRHLQECGRPWGLRSRLQSPALLFRPDTAGLAVGSGPDSTRSQEQSHSWSFLR